MNFRTGDILLWRSTQFWDKFSDYTIQINGLHCGLIFHGDIIAHYSECGTSPSKTYVTFNVDRIYPLEEIIGHIWSRPNGAAIYVIRRTNGPDVPEEQAVKAYEDMLKMEKYSFKHTIYIAIAAYLRIARVAPITGVNGKRWQMCSTINSYFLYQFGLLDDDAHPNEILPLDFDNLKFWQKDQYEKVVIFDKGTYTSDWLFAGLYNALGMIFFEPVQNDRVNEILGNYNFPRTKLVKVAS